MASAALYLERDSELYHSLASFYADELFVGRGVDWSRSEGGRWKIDHEIVTRQNTFIDYVLPWIQATGPALGTVVELGCGTGPKTVGLATHADVVLSSDLDPLSIEAARVRTSGYGLDNVELDVANAVDAIAAARTSLPDGVDMVVLCAVLEHFTLDERLSVLAESWSLLRDGGRLVVQETPNRLVPFDSHSSRLPFFDTLPDELALRIAPLSPREDWRQDVVGAADPALSLIREGRGLSYHEFEVAMGGIDVVASSVVADGWDVPLLRLDAVTLDETWLRYRLRALAPAVPSGFSRYWLSFVFRKGGRPPPHRPDVSVEALSAGASFDLDRAGAFLPPSGCVTLTSAGHRQLVLAAPAATDLDVRLEDGASGRQLATLDTEDVAAVGASHPEWNGQRTFAIDLPPIDRLRVVNQSISPLLLDLVELR